MSVQRIVIGLAAVTLLAGSAVSFAQSGPAKKPPAAPATVELLLVQNASSVAIDAGKHTLTLKGVGPSTLYFSDRPVRLAGHYRTKEDYLPLWTQGKDSFFKDPPNATLSVFEKGQKELTDVVVKLQHPRLEGDDLTYDITVIEGKLPESGGPSALFIDVIGMPLTPYSYAGAARRGRYYR